MAQALTADVARLRKRLAEFSDDLNGKAAADRLKRVGKAMAAKAEQEVRNESSKTPGHTLSDQSMSGWNRGKPARIGTRVTVHGARNVLVTPDRTAGLWRVLNDGRQGRAKGESRERSRYVKKSGEVRTYRSRVKRTSGATAGKGTWDKATRVMARDGAKLMTLDIVASFRKTFGG